MIDAVSYDDNSGGMIRWRRRDKEIVSEGSESQIDRDDGTTHHQQAIMILVHYQ